MHSGRVAKFVAIAFVFIVICEACSYLVIAASRSMLVEPIWRTSSIFADQTKRIETLLKNHNSLIGEVDPTLGWRLRRGLSRDGIEINSQGLRSQKTYLDQPTREKLRVAAFGDSFVFGSEVTNEQSWSHVAEKAESNLEILNYAVPGYGTDQALMRFELEGEELNPKIALMGFVPTDMRRNVNVYRRFLHIKESLATKPRYKLQQDGTLAYVPPPVTSLSDWRKVSTEPDVIRDWGKNDFFYEPIVYENVLYDWSATVRLAAALIVRINRRYFYSDRIYIESRFNRVSEAFKIQRAILKRFTKHAKNKGRVPVILLLPEKRDLLAHLNNKPTRLDDVTAVVPNQAIILNATQTLAKAAKEAGVNALFAPGMHYSAIGNQALGEWLAKELACLSEQFMKCNWHLTMGSNN